MTGRDIDCEEVIEHLLAFLDREVDGDTRARIDAHLQRCRDCFTRAEFERRLRARVRQTTEVRAPERLHRRIGELIDTF